MAFKMNKEGFTFYTKPKGPTKHHEMGPTKKENMGYPRYGKKHDGPSFNAELRKEAMDPNTTMNEGFKEKVLSSKGPTKKDMGYPKKKYGLSCAWRRSYNK